MGIFSLIAGWIKSPTATPPAASGVARALAGHVHPNDAVALKVEHDTSIYEPAAGHILFREAILDNRNRLCGYRFLLRSALQQGDQTLHHIHNRDTLFLKLLHSADVASFAIRRMAVVPVQQHSLLEGHFRFLAAPNTVFLVDMRRIDMPQDDLLVKLQEARQGGCKIAMAGFSSEQHTPRLLQSADMLFLQMSDYSLLELQKLIGQLRSACPALVLVVEGVPTWSEQRMCLALGVKYCMGGFVSAVDRDQPQVGVMEPGRVVSIEMLNLLRREAEIAELGLAAKKDPAITVQLLKWANSPMAGLRTPVTTLDQAIMVLGRETLYRWLTMSIFRAGRTNKERDEALLEVALTRARFLETVEGPELSRASRDELFLVGMLSLFEALLAMPMEKILSEMHLSPSIAEVLLRSSGPYGRYLRLALVMEKGQVRQIEDLAQTLGIAMDGLESTNLSAFNWAQQALGGSMQAAPARMH